MVFLLVWSFPLELGMLLARPAVGQSDDARRMAGMRTAPTARCMSASVALVDIVAPAIRGRLNKASTPAAAYRGRRFVRLRP
jgi:hypothetical protein